MLSDSTDMSPIVVGVQQDRVRPAPTVFRPGINTLVLQAEKLRVSFMKRFSYLVKVRHNPGLSVLHSNLLSTNYGNITPHYYISYLDYAAKM